ncbi:MAG: DPP IV N-terminal domain-containing protein, partial [Enterobacterales bacterium]|nr:DPP IV N-terminal domain-containing protein [Enterobacterales bacterium]
QLWTISPNGGEPRQITHGKHSVQSALSWHPDGASLFFVMDNSVVRCKVHSGEITRLTIRSEQPPCAEAVVVSPDGNHVAFMREIAGWPQFFMVNLNG